MAATVIAAIAAVALSCRSKQPNDAPPQHPPALWKSASVRPAYPYSVVRGGVYSAEEFKQAVARDPAVAAHYEPLRSGQLRPVKLAAGQAAYVSYRVNNAIYWTKRPVRLMPGEQLLTDGEYALRARCGNRLSRTPRFPIRPYDPPPLVAEEKEPGPDPPMIPARFDVGVTPAPILPAGPWPPALGGIAGAPSAPAPAEFGVPGAFLSAPPFGSAVLGGIVITPPVRTSESGSTGGAIAAAPPPAPPIGPTLPGGISTPPLTPELPSDPILPGGIPITPFTPTPTPSSPAAPGGIPIPPFPRRPASGSTAGETAATPPVPGAPIGPTLPGGIPMPPLTPVFPSDPILPGGIPDTPFTPTLPSEPPAGETPSTPTPPVAVPEPKAIVLLGPMLLVIAARLLRRKIT